jgi:hypothetical protein
MIIHANKNIHFHFDLVQSFARDLGSVNDTDYVVLQQTKQTVRDAIISWIIEDAVEETSAPPTTTSDPVPAK